MSNQLRDLLAEWHPQRNELEWVLGVVYRTEGPSYRKAGAMMLFNSLGQQFGMLSGGCLESDIQRYAQQVMQSGINKTLCYDGSDEDDLSFQLGIGCGGTVYLQLQRVDSGNHYLELDKLYASLQQHRHGVFHLLIKNKSSSQARFEQIEGRNNSKASVISVNNLQWLEIPIIPAPHLLLVGGGLDARPVTALAGELGWRISLWDPRPANGRMAYFPFVQQALDGPATQLRDVCQNESVDAAILMSHSIELDASALQALPGCSLRYIALLGPENRKQKVLETAAVSESDLSCRLAGPAGLSLGGELPESIALSIIAECHAALFSKNAISISQVLNP